MFMILRKESQVVIWRWVQRRGNWDEGAYMLLHAIQSVSAVKLSKKHLTVLFHSFGFISNTRSLHCL